MPFDRLLAGALQPTLLVRDPAAARAKFVVDLDRTLAGRATQRTQAADAEAHANAMAKYATTPWAALHRPRPEPERPVIAKPQGYMLDAIRRDLALAEYDRRASELRRWR